MKLVHATPDVAAQRVGPWLCQAMNCPSGDDLENSLNGADNYIIESEGEAIGWLGLRPVIDAMTLDIAVKAKHRRRWATKSLLRDASDVLFKHYDFVILHAKKPSAVKMALSLGANPLYTGDMVKAGVFILSRANFCNGRFH